jgi:hypothetical protein
VFTPVVGRVAASSGPPGLLLGAGAAGMAAMSARSGRVPGHVTATEQAGFMASRPRDEPDGSSGSPWQVPTATAASAAHQARATGTSAAAAGGAAGSAASGAASGGSAASGAPGGAAGAAYPAGAAAQVVVRVAGQARDAAGRAVAGDDAEDAR